jgi:hypothetical protein
VMPQHVELLIEATQADQLREFVEWLSGRCEMPSARLRSFDATPVERATFLAKCRSYIAWTAVLDGYSKAPNEYQWSGVYRDPDSCVISNCGIRETSDEYQVMTPPTYDFDRPSSYDIKRITHALRHGYPLGGAKFRQKIEAMLRANSTWQPRRREFNFRYAE